MSDSTIDTIQKFLGFGSVAFGVAAVLAPQRLGATYAVRDDSPENNFVSRQWGTRTLVLGALMLAARPGDELRRMLTASAALNTVDAVAALGAPGLPARARLMVAATSGGFAAVAGYGLSQDA